MNEREEQIYRRIHDLVTLQLEGTTAQQDQLELNQLVTGDPRARQIYIAYIQELASLHWSYAYDSWDTLNKVLVNSEQSDSPPATQQRAIPRAVWVGLSAAVLLLASISWYRGQAQLPGDAVGPDGLAAETAVVSVPSVSVPSVATLAHVSDAVWSAGQKPVAELSRLRPGQILELDAGHLEIIFDSGVEVVLTGPLHFEIRTAMSAYCTLGAISARVSDQGKGFTIETPNASVVDLGTEFGLTVRETGDTEVAVFRGIVDLAVDSKLEDPALNQRQRLNQGEALRVSKNGEFNRLVSITSEDFPIAAANRSRIPTRQPIISAVRDNIRSPESNKFYRIVRSGLREDVQAFVDRDHQWNGIDETGLPAELLGSEYVMPFNDDKFVKHLEISVTLSRPTVLYLFVSDAVPVPDWLARDFTRTSMQIGLDEAKSRFRKDRETESGPGNSIETLFPVWKRVVSHPTTVTLGSVDRPNPPEGYNIYGIAAVALEDKTESK